MTPADLAGLLRSIPDHPSPASPSGHHPAAVRRHSPAHRDRRHRRAGADPRPVDLVAGVEARGFVVGTPLALALGAGFVPLRKAGKLPWRTVRQAYSLE